MKTPPPSSPPTGSAGRHSPLDWPAEAGIGRELATEIRAAAARRHRTRMRAALVGACAVLAVGVASFWPRGGALAGASAAAPSRVSAPERRALPDGTVAELRDDAAIRVEFSAAVRRVVLVSGEAHFEVAKNPARPFVVAADGIEARAVGTAFAVGRGGTGVEVIVTEGRVAVARGSGAPALVGVGEQATLPAGTTAAPVVATLTAAELEHRLSWRVPRLEFSGAPLEDVVRTFAAHGSVRLAIGDAALRDVRVSGVLRADNADALLQLLAADHGITAEPRAGETLLVRRR